jgi:tetratricopeptide (TPR) repeat protein
MRFRLASLTLAASFVLLWTLNPLTASGERTISGRLVFENSDFSCDSTMSVTLLVSGVRPVQTVFPGMGCHFAFTSVPNGPYSLKIEISGHEPIIESLDSFDVGHEVTVFVRMAPSSARNTNKTGSNVVDASEFLQRYPKKAVSFFEKGSESLKQKKNDEAVKYLRNAVELAPTFYEAHNQLGLAYLAAGRKDDAEQEFIKARDLNSTNIDPLLNLTQLYLDQNQPDLAVKTAEQAVKTNSHSAPAFFSLGVALYKAMQLERAENELKRALDLAPKSGTIRLALANVYLKQQRYDSTMEQLNTYLAENPKGEQRQAALDMRDQLQQALASQRP